MANTNKINLADLEKIAREQGLPALDNQILKEPSPLLEKISKPTIRRTRTKITRNGFILFFLLFLRCSSFNHATQCADSFL